MIRPLPLLIAIALLLVARMVARVTDAQLARRNATLYVVALLVLLAALQGFAHWFPPAASANDMGLVLEWVSNDWHLTSPFVNLLVALLAIAMAPVQSHRPRTLGVILTVVALAIAFVSTDQPIVLTVLWA
ncbi:MAG: cytochrome bd-type quinol oxidase subunit 2, partial [Planctomycetota bacterium]